jgi:hypothetical protein
VRQASREKARLVHCGGTHARGGGCSRSGGFDGV